MFAKDIPGIEDLGDACELAWCCWDSDVAEWGVWARRTGGTGGTDWIEWSIDAGGRIDVGSEERSRGSGGDALGLLLAHFLLGPENTLGRTCDCSFTVNGLC